MSKSPAKLSFSDLAEFRKSRGMTQTEFWNKLGITQSAGSRYETFGSNNISNPVKLILALLEMGVLNDDSIEKARKVIVKAEQ